MCACILVSTEHGFAPGSAQYAWIARDLALVDRSKTPWLVFSGHRPFYIDSPYPDQVSGAGCDRGLRRLLLFP